MEDQTALFRRMIDNEDNGNVFGRLLGIHTAEVREGYCRMEMDILPDHRNPIGSVHGGVLYTIADCAAGGASWSYGERMTTLSSDFHFLRPGIGVSSINAVGETIKHGRQVTVVNVKVRDQNGKELCEGLFTYMTIGIPV